MANEQYHGPSGQCFSTLDVWPFSSDVVTDAEIPALPAILAMSRPNSAPTVTETALAKLMPSPRVQSMMALVRSRKKKAAKGKFTP